MVAALLLKDRFDKVILLERQSKERFLTTRGFTFPIVFSPAAIKVLAEVGVWEAIQQEQSPFFGVVIHKRLLGREFTWTAKRDGVYSHWRNHIVAGLYDRVSQEGIDVHFEAEVTDIDFAGGVCTEATLGEIRFDLLLGADGMYSQTRGLMAKAHPGFAEEEFRSTRLDRWYAYRLPSVGALAERLGGGERGFASHIYVDNLAAFPDDRFRVITTAMTQPHDEICVVVKHGVALDRDRVRELNDVFFSPMVDRNVLDREWEAGVGGSYDHVRIPTFHLDSALLVGDAAHGFESTGDLINVGISSVGSLRGLLDEHEDIPSALAAYDATVGRSLRTYTDYALRRSLEKITAEVAAFEAGALLRVNNHHPSLWGIFEDDFEVSRYMQRYERDRRRIKAGTAVLAAGALLAGLLRRKTRA
jgi:2-polyprenyl-6-methoxyphenol hydroxylase-like FAD-dependent oxidoreductase